MLVGIPTEITDSRRDSSQHIEIYISYFTLFSLVSLSKKRKKKIVW